MSFAPKQTLEEGFNKFVVRNPEGCWGWTGCAPKNPGYGQFRSNNKLIRAHRGSWMIHFGEIPSGLWVLHKCDNRICTKPDHLFLGTIMDNIKDKVKKGRHRWGIQNKLQKEDVLMIKELLLNNSIRSVAKMFNVADPTIGFIKHGKSWKDITCRN